MSRWSVNTHTFSKVSGSIVMNSLLLDDYLISGSLTKNLNDTSKVKFSVPNEQGKDLVPGATLVDVKYGNDRKFFGTVSKKTLNNLTGIYDFEAVGVLGSYQFMPNYEDYGVDTIESYIATEMSRFKGTASSPYDCDNPWTLVYTGHNEIPSTYGDIETENLGLIPSFNLNLQKTSANAYEFLRLITRDKNYLLPSSVTSNKTSLFWYEEGEKAYFKRISGVNEQTVDYDDNLISYTYENTPQVTKYYAKNTVEGAYPPYGQTTYSQYPATFNFKVLKLPQKNDKTAYSFDELYQAMDRAVPSWGAFEAYAFDKHILDESVPWFDMSKKVRMNMYIDGMERYTNVNIVQIVYDFCDSSKDRVKLGKVSNSITVSSEQESRDFQAALKDRLETSGGQMTGAITYDGGTSFDGDGLKIDDRYALTCNIIDMASIESGVPNTTDGAIVANAQYVSSGLIKVKPSTTYTVSGSSSWANTHPRTVRYMDTESHVVSWDNNDDSSMTWTFTTPSTCNYIKVAWIGNSGIQPSHLSNIMLEKGSSASPYVPYTMDGVEVAERLSYKKTYFTPQNCTARTSFDNCYYFKENGIVHIHIGIENLTTLSNQRVQIGTLPSGFRPKNYVASGGWSLNGSTGNTACTVTVNSGGEVYIMATYQYNIADFCYLAEL